MTDLENMVLQAIVESEYQDGSGEIIDCPVWVDYLWDLEELGLKKSGAMGSLTKKGYIRTNGETVAITKLGYDALRKENKKDGKEIL